jgi:hypothetical protein
MRLKIAVFAPVHRASVRRDTAQKVFSRTIDLRT